MAIDQFLIRCICGHWKNTHKGDVGYCGAMFDYGECWCNCNEYVQDNIEYLLAKYEEKNKA